MILGREEFFNVTKLLHNALQGNPHGLTEEDWEVFFRYNEMNARELESDWDLIIIHDPQPAALRRNARRPRQALDLALPHRPLDPERRDALDGWCRHRGVRRKVFHLQQYVPAGLDGKVEIVPPAIDPLSPKNMALSPEDAAFVCDQFGVDVDRPLICQVSRFDPWKDPLGVIDAYRMVKQEVPERAARARRVDGDRRPRGLGVLPQDLRTRRATRTSRSSTTSTTSARSRSTPSSRRPTSCSRSRSARASG